MHRGYVKLWRRIDTSEVSLLPHSHFRVWCWVLTNACHKSLAVSGITLEPGELLTTYGRIGKALEWRENRSYHQLSTRQLRTAVQNLVNLNMLELRQEVRQGCLRLKVLHWAEYQGTIDLTATGVATELRQDLDRTATTEQEGKNSKKVKKEPKTLVPSEDEQAVFDRWKEVIGANGRTHLDAPRLKAIRWAIDNYGADGAMEALQGLGNDSWSMEGPLSRREIKMVFRDAAHIERYMSAAVRKLTPIQELMRASGHTGVGE